MFNVENQKIDSSDMLNVNNVGILEDIVSKEDDYNSIALLVKHNIVSKKEIVLYTLKGLEKEKNNITPDSYTRLFSLIPKEDLLMCLFDYLKSNSDVLTTGDISYLVEIYKHVQ